MKILKILTAFLTLVSLQIAAAQWLHVPPPVEARGLMMVGGGVPVVAGGPKQCTDGTHDSANLEIIRCEDFEGSSDCYEGTMTCRATFSYASYYEFDYTTTILEGNYSAISADSGIARVNFSYTDNIYGYMLFRPTIIPASSYYYWGQLYTEDSTEIAEWNVNSSGHLYIRSGGSTAESTGVVSINTTYSVWWGFEKGTGSNSKVWACFSTNTTIPADITTSGNCAYMANGNVTTQPNRWEFIPEGSAKMTYIFDHIRIKSTGAFGSNPD